MSNGETVIIVGGGLAGICAARELIRNNIPFELFEAGGRLGGRVKTDVIDGYRLDHGFQVLLTAYPECKDQLDYQDLDLKIFYPGALVFYDREFHSLADPFRQPLEGLKTLFGKVGA